jgi:hypothetical protein
MRIPPPLLASIMKLLVNTEYQKAAQKMRYFSQFNIFINEGVFCPTLAVIVLPMFSNYSNHYECTNLAQKYEELAKRVRKH